MAQVLATAFYAVMFAALAYFVHRVAWFVRFRRLQGQLVEEATRRLDEAAAVSMTEWDRRAEVSWFGSGHPRDDISPARYVRRVEDNLERCREIVAKGLTPCRNTFVAAMEAAASGRANHEQQDEVELLRVPRLGGDPRSIRLSLLFPRLPPATPPDASLYELEVRSRYGLVPRLLAFLLGAADVVYSSRHVARMSQNAQVPVGVILRRLSLVVLILAVLVLDITFQVRARMVVVAERLLRHERLPVTGDLGDLLNENLPTVAALSVWLAVYGTLYLLVYLFLRRRSQKHLRRLAEMRAQAEADVLAIHGRHERELADWAFDYARTLDEEAAMIARQADMLIGRAVHRLRRRIASPELLGHAARVREALFERLPESSKRLSDVATDQQHSLAHHVWPRASEMGYQIAQARYRQAWRQLSAALMELRGQRPDPELAQTLWRTLARYASIFDGLVPPDFAATLRDDFDRNATRVVEETERDLQELDARLRDLARSLEDRLGVVAALVESRVELAERSIEADVARLGAEVLQVRERARLEAMAFEI